MALINVARRLVEVPQHGHQAVAPTVGAADVGATGANVGNLGSMLSAGKLHSSTNKEIDSNNILLLSQVAATPIPPADFDMTAHCFKVS